jgi:fatty-acyl-CoA synthase
MERPLFAPTKERAAAARAAWLRALELTAPIRGDAMPCLPVLVDELAGKYGAAPALLAGDECWTYRALAQAMNRYARWARGEGIREGDVVAIVMAGGPDYLALWLGLTRIGAVAALVNVNLAGDGLARAIALAAPAHVIAGAGLAAAVAAVRTRLPGHVRCWGLGESADDCPRIDDAVAHADGGALADVAPPALGQRALYLYTSGTAGFPKAAAISHRRIVEWSYWFAGIMGTGAQDRLYDCLPMYHAIGGISGIGAMLVSGGSVVLRPRFSASAFWHDVVQGDCTLFLYIGELCRYLVASPAHPDETRHKLRLCCGSGLRPDIWERFQERFRIPQILEFYAATEGAVSLYNCEGKPGAVGRVPPFLAHRWPVALVQVDCETGEPLRGADGLCLRAGANEAGEALGRVAEGASGGAGRFEGYADGTASDTKLLRHVFAPGDMWFRTGDLLVRDEEGFFRFVDRLGDTYRWKGENVAASEVAATIAACAHVVEAVVYGVRVPGAEGRAGMAAIVPGHGFDPAALWRDIAARLPEYARPLFLRIAPAIETTATLRPQKQGLMRDGFDPDATRDPLYFADRAQQAFVPLDAALYRRIVTGELRL